MSAESAADAPRQDGLLETALYVDDIQCSAVFYQSLFGFAATRTST